jgi:hypothetical protein
MGTIGKIIGYAMWIISGILMFIFWMGAMMHWLGSFLGFVLGLVLSPGLVIFPIIFWIKEGVFPTTYFIFWGIGIIGLIITAISYTGEE